MADRSYAPDVIIGIVGALVVGYWLNSNANVSIGDPGNATDPGGGSDPYGAGSSLTAWAQAITNFENVNPSYNNPGGINETGDAGRTSNGIAMYSTWTAGYSRLLTILQSYINSYPTMTLDQATARYSGASGQVLANYQESVSEALGLDGSTPISWIGGTPSSSTQWFDPSSGLLTGG